eukprot:1786780-Rhodomonas_salina.1
MPSHLQDAQDELSRSLQREANSALHLAADKGEAEKVRELISTRADVNAVALRFTPIRIACARGHAEVVDILLKHGAQPGTVQTTTGVTNALEDVPGPLYWAVVCGHLPVAKLLLDSKADVNEPEAGSHLSPLHWAVKTGRDDVAKLLLDRGAKVDARDSGENTPLVDAAILGHPGLAKLLLEKKADVRARNEVGLSLMHTAAQGGSAEVVQLLLDAGAEVRARDNEEHLEPLHMAASEGHCEVALCLRERGALTDARTTKGHTPLHVAALAGQDAMVERLVEMKADVGAKDVTGAVALHMAAACCSAHTVRALLAAAPPLLAARDHDGDTPLHIAAGNGRSGAVHALLDAGAAVNALNRERSTCLDRCLFSQMAIAQCGWQLAPDIVPQELAATERLLREHGGTTHYDDQICSDCNIL